MSYPQIRAKLLDKRMSPHVPPNDRRVGARKLLRVTLRARLTERRRYARNPLRLVLR